jgi:hypothetical protein
MTTPTPEPTSLSLQGAADAAAPPVEVTDLTIAHLVGEVYDAAPAAERCRLLEQLIRPLGVLSLVAVAGGVFAKLRFRAGWPELHLAPDDARDVSATAVTALAEYVQQVSVESVDGLAHWLSNSPVLAGSAAAALLATLLHRRRRGQK